MTKRYRLTSGALMDGAMREPGYEFDVPDNRVPPVGAVEVESAAFLSGFGNADRPAELKNQPAGVLPGKKTYVDSPARDERPRQKRYRLLGRAEMNGAVREPGYEFSLPEGQLGPHRTVVSSNHGAQIADDLKTTLVDHPLYEEIDEGLAQERDEMHARHTEEIEKIDQVQERNALIQKHAEESAALRERETVANMEARQKREDDQLKERHEAELAGINERKVHPRVVIPAEANEDDLKRRQAAELETMGKKHATEAAAIKKEEAPPLAAAD